MLCTSYRRTAFLCFLPFQIAKIESGQHFVKSAVKFHDFVHVLKKETGFWVALSELIHTLFYGSFSHHRTPPSKSRDCWAFTLSICCARKNGGSCLCITSIAFAFWFLLIALYRLTLKLCFNTL